MIEVITSVVTVLGVLGGAWLGNKLSRQSSREQVLFSHAHKRREEILTRLYGLMLVMRASYTKAAGRLDPDHVKLLGKTHEEVERAYQVFKDNLAKMKRYYRMNAIWLPPQLCDKIEYVLEELFGEQEEKIFWSVASREIFAGDEDVEQQIEKQKQEYRQATEWFEEEAKPAIRELETEFRTILRVEDHRAKWSRFAKSSEP